MTVAATAVRQTIKTPRLAVTPSAGFPLPPLPLADDAPLRTDRPWPLNESDLDLPAPYRHSRESGNPEAALDAPHYLGSLTAHQRGIPGPLSLDVMLSADGSAVEIGPFTLGRHNTHWLQRLVSIAVALTQPPPPPFAIEGRRHRGGLPPETGRNIAGWDLAEGLAEGETRP